jgi:hypothetical protein
MALAVVSLVAAIPAGIMALLAIMALLGSAGEMSTLLLAVTGGATAIGVLVALLPVVILVGKRKTKAAPVKAAKEKGQPAGVSGAQTAELVGAESEEKSEEQEDTESLASSDDSEAFASGEDIEASDDFKFEDDAFMEDELADVEPEPEPEPKKKKKKKKR